MKIKLFSVFFFVLLLVSYQARAEVIINEILAEDEDSSKNEFIELYNTSDNSVILDGYSLKRKTSSGTEYTLVSSSKFFGTIAPREYFVIAHPEYFSKINADLQYSGNSSIYSFAADNTILLYDKSGKLVDKVGFGKASDFFESVAQNPTTIKSIGRIDFKNTNNNGKDFVFNIPTPSRENKIYEEPVIEKKNYTNNILITEIYPYPKGGADEFIEIYNGSNEKIDLQNWSLHDGSVSGEYIYPSQTLEPQKYFVVYSKTYKFALNNSGSESLTLYNPNKEKVFYVSYDGAKEGASYNYNGTAWHWSKYLTPGAENIFENVSEAKIEKDDDIYANVYANFEITGLSDSAKVTWDFGDSRKSYLRKTRHKYLDEGKYEASVKYSDGNEDIVKNFTVNVEKFPHLKIRIIEIAANPKGADTDQEYFLISNKSKKNLNLKGWSIATGWKKHFINHPIKEDFNIKRGKNKKITHKSSSFTLNNSKAKIQLRYPDGKIAQEIKYKKEEGIKDDEIYQKVKGEGWVWKNQNAKIKNQNLGSNIKQINQSLAILNIEKVENTKIISQQPEVIEEKDTLTKKVEFEILKMKSFGKTDLLNSGYKIKTVKEVDGKYIFTSQNQSKEHYAIVFLKSISSSINKKINWLINFF